jgi:hypothetical protein
MTTNRRIVEVARAVTESGNRLRAPVIGGSMLPLIWAGDCLIAQPVAAADVVPGDLVLFERTGSLVAHRMIRRCRIDGAEYLVTKGDWFEQPDSPLPPASLIGKIVAIDRGGRTIRLDRGFGGVVVKTTGWIARFLPWLLPGLRRLWRGMKEWCTAMGVIRGSRAAPPDVSEPEASGKQRTAMGPIPHEAVNNVWPMGVVRGRKGHSPPDVSERSMRADKGRRKNVTLRTAMGIVKGRGASPLDMSECNARADEQRELAQWCRPEPDPERLSASLSQWSRSSHPDRLAAWIEAEGVAPLCGYQLKRLHLAAASGDGWLVRQLTGAYYRTTARNLRRYHHLGPLLERFNQSGISVLVLKGAVLAVTVYHEVGLREMSDVDLLVKPEQLEATDRLLTRAGYRAIDRAAVDLARPGFGHLTTLDYRDTESIKPAIHLHWHLINSTVPHADYSRRIDLNGVWARAERFSIDQATARGLASDDLVIYLCEHAMRVSHSLSRLVWAADLAWLIHRERDRLDWEVIVQRAEQWGINRLIQPVLEFVHNSMGAAVPQPVLTALRPGAPSPGEWLFSFCLKRGIRRGGMSYLAHAALRRGFIAKGRFILGTLCPPKTVLAQHLFLSPDRPVFQNYVIRFVEVVGQFIRLLCRQFPSPHR